jgi:type VI secretion system protein VasG
MAVNLRSLIGKLNDASRTALETAAAMCMARTHYDVEIEHYLLKLLDGTDTDFPRIVKHFGLDRSRLSDELLRSLDKIKTGNARNPAFSPKLVDMFSQSWLIGSLEFGATQIRSGFTVLALVSDSSLSALIGSASREFQKLQPEALRKEFPSIAAGSREDVTASASAEASSGAADRRSSGKTPNLDQFTVDLTGNARQGKIDPVLGRDAEIRQVIDILTRRRQNNPILTGEAGVGKTAVVEGFARRIAQGDVPPALRNVTLRSLDLALLQAGAGIKGEFENRLKGLIEEVKSSPTPIILFIDEAHTMIGAGGQAGQNDAANLLKPALARGELRTIAATTWSEYKKYFEKDPALTRRFQVVKVEEPSEEICAVMLRGIVPALESHHNVRILEEGLQAAVRLSHRYLPDRQLPDKAVSVLDTACARLALGQNATAPAIEDTLRQMEDLQVRSRVLEREATLGADHGEQLELIAQQHAECEARLSTLNTRWQGELALVNRIRDVRSQIESYSSREAPQVASGFSAVAVKPTVDTGALRLELARLNQELETLQGETPLVRVSVDAQIVADVISAWTGIPIGKMLKDEVQTILHLDAHLGKRVIGQQHALEAVAERIRTSKATLEDPNKPVGVFLLVGPSGVGKTETALALSDLLYGGERNLITINMSEFQEPHTVSTLKGSPPASLFRGSARRSGKSAPRCIGVVFSGVRQRRYGGWRGP